jgi:hypothetical protein
MRLRYRRRVDARGLLGLSLTVARRGYRVNSSSLSIREGDLSSTCVRREAIPDNHVDREKIETYVTLRAWTPQLIKVTDDNVLLGPGSCPKTAY